jgi:hypothetical protein
MQIRVTPPKRSSHLRFGAGEVLPWNGEAAIDPAYAIAAE